MSRGRRHYRPRTGVEGAPVPLPRSACPSGKLGWFGERDARLALAHARERHEPVAERLPVRWYRCDRCSSYHLTGMAEHERQDGSEAA